MNVFNKIIIGPNNTNVTNLSEIYRMSIFNNDTCEGGNSQVIGPCSFPGYGNIAHDGHWSASASFAHCHATRGF